MDYVEIEQGVKGILADKLNVDSAKITLDSSLTDDLGMDSFASIEVIYELEEKFDIKIADANVGQVKIVKDVVDYVAAQRKLSST